MNAKDVIDCYVADVALRLPRAQRNDVAFELRALIDEGLQDQADATGRAVDAALATEFLNTFGHPADVAARYRPTLTIIDPADGPVFLRATLVGLALIWGLGLLGRLLQPMGSAGWLGALGQWWAGTVIPSPWWPGVLVVWFAGAAWARRRWPQAARWKPRAADRLQGGRGALVLALMGIVGGLYTLVNPRWLLDFFWGGQAAPAAYAALGYTEAFLHSPQALLLLALLLINVPMFTIAIVKGRWPALILRAQDGLVLLTCAVMVWAIADGPIFATAVSDRTAKFLMLLIVAATLVATVIKRLRRVKPMPGSPA